MVVDDDEEVIEDFYTLSLKRCAPGRKLGGWNALVGKEGGRGDE
jgi:hypothetical protein